MVTGMMALLSRNIHSYAQFSRESKPEDTLSDRFNPFTQPLALSDMAETATQMLEGSPHGRLNLDLDLSKQNGGND